MPDTTYGSCPTCGRPSIVVLLNGTLRAHKTPGRQPCPGSGGPPGEPGVNGRTRAGQYENCGVCGWPMSGDNLYVDLRGVRNCRHCGVRRMAACRARKRARTLLAEVRAGHPAKRFGALAGLMFTEMRPLSPAEREPYYRDENRVLTEAERIAGEFAQRRLPREWLAGYTGIPEAAIEDRLAVARDAHARGEATPTTMPLPGEDGRWHLGRLAIWRANWARDAFASKRGPDPWVPLVERAIAKHGPAVTPAEVAEVLLEAGIDVHPARIARVIRDRGLRKIQPTVSRDAEAAVLESLRWDGLVTVQQLADAYGVSASVVTGAVQRKELTVAKWEGRRRLFDPAKVAARADGRPGPVDAGGPLALKPPPKPRQEWAIGIGT